jgi:hypothetical protein
MSPSITITTTNQEASMVYTTSYPSGSWTEWVDGVAIVPAAVTGSIVRGMSGSPLCQLPTQGPSCAKTSRARFINRFDRVDKN